MVNAVPKNRKFTVGIVSDGKYGDRAFEIIKEKFHTKWILVPDIPSTVMIDDDIELDIPECDLYVSYVRHPDLILTLCELQKPLILGITPGLGLYKQAEMINAKVVSPRTMCSLEPNTEIPEIDEFAEFFGKPIFHIISNKDGIVTEVDILRSSPCGSSHVAVEFFKNKKISVKTLQEFALSVCHECRAPRFGHTCDKEVSGIIHVLSFFDGWLDLTGNLEMESELKDFIDSLKNELYTRSNVSNVLK